SFEYDAEGLLLSATNQFVRAELERDGYGRVIREMQGGRVVESVYDERGLRTKRCANSGHELEWAYDGNGRVARVNLPGNDWLEFTRDAAGRDVERRMRGGFVLRQEYDSADRLTSQWAGLEAGASRAVAAVAERQYRYDLNDNVTAAYDMPFGDSRYNYDPDARVTGAARERGRSEGFHYDASGNITASIREAGTGDRRDASTAVIKMQFVGRGGRLEQAGETRYFYDADGRLTEKHVDAGIWRYQWTTQGQLRSIVTPEGDVWTYDYDAFGRRVRKKGPDSTTTYVWDGGVVAEEVTQEGSASSTTTWLFEQSSFRPVVKIEDGKSYACVTDQIGVPRELVTSEGRLEWAARLSVWGEVQEQRADQIDCEIRFQGQWHDEESGLYYNWNRYYDAETGRYISPDPIGLNGGTRPYGYVHNPLSWIDPSGLGLSGVDFTGSPDLFPVTGSQKNIVEITMQGSRARDFTQAYKAAGINEADAAGYTWHHVNDFDPVTGKTTMQLVETSAHEATFPHEGSVRQFEQQFKVSYDTPEAVKVS